MIPFAKRFAIVSGIITGTLLVVNFAVIDPVEGATIPSGSVDESTVDSRMETTEELVYLFAPINSTKTYLMDAQGNEIFSWESEYRPGLAVYLLEDGSLLHTGNIQSGSFDAGGAGGMVEIIALDNSVSWSFQYADENVQAHHDVAMLPNGHILIAAWEKISAQAAIEAGRDPDLLAEGELWADHIIEVDPQTSEIVWEWHVMDHLVQDQDASKDNYGDPAALPGKVNLNYVSGKAEADWTHINAIDYNAELDQILLSVHGFSEVWIIDHSISSAEAAGEAGDLLYRWGNPQAYGRGDAQDQQLFSQHDARWIPEGYPGAGNILIFNNGDARTRPYSSVEEIVVPVGEDGGYALDDGQPFGPESVTWHYQAEIAQDFFASRISGVQRLANGNTLICDGTSGKFFEVTPDGETAWEYDYGGEVFRLTAIPVDSPALEKLDLYQGQQLRAAARSAQGSGEKRPALR